jgi:cytochrome c556
MRGSVTAVVCTLWALTVGGLALRASEKPTDAYQQTMKDLAAANTALRNDVKAIESAGAYPDYNPIEKDAAAIKAAFEKTAGFWAGKKADEAVKLAETGAKHADALEAARKARDYDALMTAAVEIGKTCGGCHTSHRDKLPDGSYEIK